MTKRTHFFMAIIIAIFFVSGCTTQIDKNSNMAIDTLPDNMMNDKTEEDMMMHDKNNMNNDNMMMEPSYNGNILAGTVTKYIEFNQNDYENALSENKIILLYFYASWCPTCRAEQPIIEEVFNNLNYEDVVGFRVSYKDSKTTTYEENLAKKFGVTYQHTKVLIKNGERVLKAPDSWDKKRYNTEIEKVVIK